MVDPFSFLSLSPLVPESRSLFLESSLLFALFAKPPRSSALLIPGELQLSLLLKKSTLNGLF